MATQRLLLSPGINVEKTSLLNEGGFSSSQLVRFFQSLLQKCGGWTRLISQAVLGTARSMLAWEDAASNQYIAIGSEQAFQIYSAGSLYTVTPTLQTDTVTPSFTTTLHSTTV